MFRWTLLSLTLFTQIIRTPGAVCSPAYGALALLPEGIALQTAAMCGTRVLRQKTTLERFEMVY